MDNSVEERVTQAKRGFRALFCNDRDTKPIGTGGRVLVKGEQGD